MAWVSLLVLVSSVLTLGSACRRNDPEITLAFGGDVTLGVRVAGEVSRNGDDFFYCFEPVASYLQAVDIAFVNMECCISDRGENLDKLHSFRAPPRAAEGVASAGIDIVSVSNNHSLDFGPLAYEDTVALLDAQGVKSVGIAYGAENRQEPVILQVKNQKIGFLAYAGFYPPKFLPFDPRPAKSERERIDRDIMDLSDKVDFLVVSMHWGQSKGDVMASQRNLGRHMIDLGVDVVVGHGPHVLQPHEYYGDGIILYSLGNFVFWPDSSPATAQTGLARVTLAKGKPAYGEFLPAQIEGFRPIPTVEAFVPLERSDPGHVKP